MKQHLDTVFKVAWMLCLTIILGGMAVEMVYKVEQDSAFSCTFHHGDLGAETVTNPS